VHYDNFGQAEPDGGAYVAARAALNELERDAAVTK
jgi:hypothetical protein